jgi:ATP-dependent helicase/nuclease subunit B
MPAFLEEFTRHIYARHHECFGDICIVLPNRRAALFIRKYLAGIIEKTTILPDFFSIEDFVMRCTGLAPADSTGMQFMLYERHMELEGAQARNVEEFLPYAAWMLSDFNEIDLYLVDPEKLFTYLSEARAMSLWNPDGRPLTAFEERYLRFFRSMHDYYSSLNTRLAEKRLAYRGMAFRTAAELIPANTDRRPWKKIIFAGFNALTTSEEKIIKSLLSEGRAEIYWDADKYYLDNERQEAGQFLRRYFRDFNSVEAGWVGDHFSLAKKISICGVPGKAGQVKYAGELLQKLAGEEGSLNNTAVVLPEEGLLIPLLNSIPAEAGRFNVTMGLPLADAPLFRLFDAIIGMHQNAARLAKTGEDKQRKYYSKDLGSIFSHPWMQMEMEMAGTEGEKPADPGRAIRDTGKFFLSEKEVAGLIAEKNIPGPTLSLLFPPEAKPASLLHSFSGLITYFKNMLTEKAGDDKKGGHIMLEYLFHFGSLIQKLRELTEKHGSIDSFKTLRLLFRQLARQQRIPFRGEPLLGLQVMGMLETRTLDFDNLIMLSVNEGILPAAKATNSFIPNDIKKEFGLPGYRHNHAVFAYHFYRLLQRAKNIWLLYDTNSDELGGGEKSQYILQLQNEIKKYNPNTLISEQLLSVTPQAGKTDKTIRIDKDEHVMQLLREHARKGFHPSSLNTYINCSLQFYFSRLIGLQETEEPEESIDARTLGTILHESLKALYQPYLNKRLEKKDFEAVKALIEPVLRAQFSKLFSLEEISYGKNYLIAEVAGRLLRQLAAKEGAWLAKGKELILLQLEKRFDTSMHLPLHGNMETIVFGGTIDRIDSMDGIIRVLDYKTGSVDERTLAPADWERLFTDPAHHMAFQLIMYLWLYSRDSGQAENLQAGVISLRAPAKGPITLMMPEKEKPGKENLAEFEERLGMLMAEIFNPEIPFAQAEDEKRCHYCIFREICNRLSPPGNY